MHRPLQELYRRCLLSPDFGSPSSLLSIPDKWLPPRISPLVRMAMPQGGRWVVEAALRSPELPVPPVDCHALLTCDLVWSTSWHGFGDGTGILVSVPELRRETDAQWQAGNLVIDAVVKQEAWQTEESLFRLVRAVCGSRFTLPCDLAGWLSHLSSLLACAVDASGTAWQSGCAVTADTRVIPSPVMALPSITSTAMYRLGEARTPAGQASAAMHAGRLGARRPF